jgi:hypothetical protein
MSSMTNKDTLIALVERLEQATDLSTPEMIDLNLAIGEAVGSWPPAANTFSLPVRYGLSLDAAESLIPDGWRLAALSNRSPWFCRLETNDFKSVTWGKGSDWITDINAGLEAKASASTGPLALCAAALRARAASTPDHPLNSMDKE